MEGDFIMSEQQKILEMIEKGQITAAEGMELLEALNINNDVVNEGQVEVYHTVKNRTFKFLKIKITSDNQSVNVNVNVPIRLLTSIGKLAGNMSVLIPAEARKEMESQGIDITSLDLPGIIDDILSGTIDDPNIVEVEAWDEAHNTMVKVRIYVD